MKGLTNLIIESYRNKYNYHKSIERLSLELEEIQAEMEGLAHHGQSLSKEQLKSSLPMPTTTSPTYTCQKLLGLIEKKDEKEKQIDALSIALDQAKIVERLSLEDQKLMMDLYHSSKCAGDVAHEYGYSYPGMYKHIRIAIEKAIQEPAKRKTVSDRFEEYSGVIELDEFDDSAPRNGEMI